MITIKGLTEERNFETGKMENGLVIHCFEASNIIRFSYHHEKIVIMLKDGACFIIKCSLAGFSNFATHYTVDGICIDFTLE